MSWFRNLPEAMWSGKEGVVNIYKDRVEIGKEKFDWSPDIHCSIETGEELQARVTVTRVLLIGIFAWALKKKKGGTRYLVLEGAEFFWSSEVDRKKIDKAHKFRQVFEDTKRKALANKENLSNE